MSALGVVLAANENPSFWNYVIVCWLVVFVTLGAYGTRTLLRGRRVTRHLPPEDRRWM